MVTVEPAPAGGRLAWRHQVAVAAARERRSVVDALGASGEQRAGQSEAKAQ